MPQVRDDLQDAEIIINQEFLNGLQRCAVTNAQVHGFKKDINLGNFQAGQVWTVEQIMQQINDANPILSPADRNRINDPALAPSVQALNRYNCEQNDALLQIKDALRREVEQEAASQAQQNASAPGQSPTNANPAAPIPTPSAPADPKLQLKKSIDDSNKELIQLKKSSKDFRKIKTNNQTHDALLWAFIVLFFSNSTKKDWALRKEQKELQDQIAEMQRNLKALEDQEKARNQQLQNKFGQGGQISPHETPVAGYAAPHQPQSPEGAQQVGPHQSLADANAAIAAQRGDLSYNINTAAAENSPAPDSGTTPHPPPQQRNR